MTLCSLRSALGQEVDTRFDGVWDTTITCPNEEGSGGARGYTFQFVSEVKNGLLRGQHRDADSPGSLTLEGKIRADGLADLNAHGRTGHPDYAIKRANTGTPYSYRIKAKFELNKSTVSRVDSRMQLRGFQAMIRRTDCIRERRAKARDFQNSVIIHWKFISPDTRRPRSTKTKFFLYYAGL